MDNTPNSRTARRQQAEAEQKSSRKHKKTPKKKKGLVKTTFKAIVIIGLLFLIAGGGLFAYYASTAPKLDENLLKDPLSSTFVTPDGKPIFQSGIEKREFVPYDEIPKELEAAILATEDVRFYKHHGIDFWRLGGAVLANFKSGFGSQGASTLTQQVIKNSFLKNEKTLKRKAQEAWLAFKLEHNYSKEEIFEMYFNKVLMSGNKYGFGTGADYFFEKKLKDLTLPEMAMLAGMPQSPNAYNPFKHPERAQKRRDIVLRLMNQHGKITREEMDGAKATQVTASLVPEDKRQNGIDTKYQAFIDAVMDDLQKAGYKDILSEGVTVQTTLKPDVQLAVEKALADDSNFGDDESIQAGMTILDTKTGEIVAVGGGRNYKLYNHNYASDQKRQPGSSIKPILDYGPAIEYLNWSTGQTLVDEKTKGIKANNVDDRYKGPITMRQSLYESRNVPAIKTFGEVGTENALSFAQSLGLPIKKLDQSDAIGGGANDFSTQQMAGAFAAFGNEGIYTTPHTIKKIILRDGKTEINLTPDPVSAMKDSTAYMITDMLRDVLKETNGSGHSANIKGLDIAGKTGTTNYDAKFKQQNNIKSGSVPDVWFTGYSTDFTISVWGGHEKRSDPIAEEQRNMPKNLFRQVMSEVSSAQSPKEFKRPNSVEEATIVVGSQPLQLASNATPSNLKRDELFVRGTLPESTYVPEEPEEVIELEAPSDFRAEYNADNQEIDLSWNHNEPDSDDFDGDVTFALSVSIDGGGSQVLNESNDDSYTYGNVEPGHTYSFNVIAKAGSLVSSPASTTLMIQATEEVPEENPEDQEEPDQNIEDDSQNDDSDSESDGSNGTNNNNGNNGNNGNGSNSNNGNNGNGNNGNGNNNNGNDGNNGNNSGNNGTNGNGSDGTNSGNNGDTNGEGSSGDVSTAPPKKPDSNTASSQKPAGTKPNDTTTSEDN
ncbi:PBP1A family penicillin-binding protein [Sporosarcina sp. A2]|uniref:PBP1A family penicillin-binding protein n=1 Tax=Sporosarcina sp. A2 TaxID=3393449 RepID=UPI003D7BF692